jgi:hypothetical protein
VAMMGIKSTNFQLIHVTASEPDVSVIASAAAAAT